MTEEQCKNVFFLSLITSEQLLEAGLFQDALSTGMLI